MFIIEARSQWRHNWANNWLNLCSVTRRHKPLMPCYYCLTLALIFKSQTGLMSCQTGAPELRQINGCLALASRCWSSVRELFKDVRRLYFKISSMLNIWKESWEEQQPMRDQEGKLRGGVTFTGLSFSTWNAVVVAPIYYKESIPVVTGNIVAQQRFNRKVLPTAWTRAMEDNSVELWQEHLWLFDVSNASPNGVWRPDIPPGQESRQCVTPLSPPSYPSPA